MAENTKIAWCDDTFNPWWGCKKVGPGCDNCYAAALDKRTGGDYWGKDLPRRTSVGNWHKPVIWNNKAEKACVRRKVFCASMADVFDNRVPIEWRVDLFNLIKSTPYLDWIILTKRIGNVKKMLPDDWGDGYQNVWLLITVVNQQEYHRDFMKLAAIPAYQRGLSIEPQLGPINLSLMGTMPKSISGSADKLVYCYIDWVITGAESGHGNRQYLEYWARSLRDQCADFGVAFFYKQNVINGKKIETPKLDGVKHIAWPEDY